MNVWSIFPNKTDFHLIVKFCGSDYWTHGGIFVVLFWYVERREDWAGDAEYLNTSLLGWI